MFTEQQIEDICVRTLGKKPRNIIPWAFSFSATALTLSSLKSQYLVGTDLFFGTTTFSPKASAGTPYDFTTTLTGLNGSVFFDFTYKDTSATTDKFCDYNQALDTFLKDVSLTENSGYSTGNLLLSFSGFRIVF